MTYVRPSSDPGVNDFLDTLAERLRPVLSELSRDCHRFLSEHPHLDTPVAGVTTGGATVPPCSPVRALAAWADSRIVDLDNATSDREHERRKASPSTWPTSPELLTDRPLPRWPWQRSTR